MASIILSQPIPEYGLKAGEQVTVIQHDERVPCSDPDSSRVRSDSAASGTRGYSVRFHGRKGWISTREVKQLIP